MRFKVMPLWFKQAMAIVGLFLALPGIFIGLGILCLALILIINGDTDATYAGLIGFTLLMLTVGTGGVTFWHGVASLNKKISKPLHLPSSWGLVGVFVLSFVIGVLIYQNDFLTGLFLPPILLIGVSIPPLIAVVWFTGRQMEGLTWRRSIIAFAGAATLSLIVFIILQFIILITTSMLNSNPTEAMIDTIELVIEGLFERNGISRMLNRRFVYIFVQLMIVIPLIGALAKPLVTLPLLGQLSRREAFLLGAMTGAGFAFVESIFYISYELRVWGWILMVQILGGAIHPLGSGLVALGWWEVVRGKPNAWSNWLAFFGIAVALHSLLSFGFLVVIFSRNSFLFQGLPSSTFLLRTVIISLIVIVVGLGLVTPWAGRSIEQHLNNASGTSSGESMVSQLTRFDRAIAIWTLASLVMILPAGIIGLQILLK